LSSEIERLIEDGLDRYGSGDLDGALLQWERALSIDPDNEAANSYVDYVRRHYELLAEGSMRTEDGEDAPFAISEEPEYHIEITAGDDGASRPSVPPPQQVAPVDSGWFIDEATHEMPPHTAPEPTDPGRPPSVVGPALAAFDLEPEPDEEPLELELAPPDRRPETPAGGINFEEATREYAGRAAAEFEPEGTPVGFTNQLTDIKKRDFGFVQPRADTQPGPMLAARTPGAASTPPSTEGLRNTTRDMPSPSRPPANAPERDPSAISQAEVLLPHAETVELDRSKLAKVTRDDPAVSAPTRDLGLRPPDRPPTKPGEDDEAEAPTRESDARAIREHAASGRGNTRPLTESTRHDISLPFDPVDAQAAQILDDIDAGAPLGEPDDDRSRRRITALFEAALQYHQVGENQKAVLAIDLALEEDPTSALAQKLIHRNRDAATQVFQTYLGDLERQPALAKPLHELSSAPISPRAAFLLSRIDGMLTIDEILDVSGMPRLEAYRYLCQLFLRGILK
jgi:hypothetical protein